MQLLEHSAHDTASFNWFYDFYGLDLRKFVHTNLPQAEFELKSLGPQASVLPIEPPLP